jgi:hypothetical protein
MKKKKLDPLKIDKFKTALASAVYNLLTDKDLI